MIASGTGTSISFPNDGADVTGIVTATVTSRDGAIDTDTAQVAIVDQIDDGDNRPLDDYDHREAEPRHHFARLGTADRLIALVYGGRRLRRRPAGVDSRRAGWVRRRRADRDAGCARFWPDGQY